MSLEKTIKTSLHAIFLGVLPLSTACTKEYSIDFYETKKTEISQEKSSNLNLYDNYTTSKDETADVCTANFTSTSGEDLTVIVTNSDEILCDAQITFIESDNNNPEQIIIASNQESTQTSLLTYQKSDNISSLQTIELNDSLPEIPGNDQGRKVISRFIKSLSKEKVEDIPELYAGCQNVDKGFNFIRDPLLFLYKKAQKLNPKILAAKVTLDQTADKTYETLEDWGAANSITKKQVDDIKDNCESIEYFWIVPPGSTNMSAAYLFATCDEKHTCDEKDSLDYQQDDFSYFSSSSNNDNINGKENDTGNSDGGSDNNQNNEFCQGTELLCDTFDLQPINTYLWEDRSSELGDFYEPANSSDGSLYLTPGFLESKKLSIPNSSSPNLNLDAKIGFPGDFLYLELWGQELSQSTDITLEFEPEENQINMYACGFSDSASVDLSSKKQINLLYQQNSVQLKIDDSLVLETQSCETLGNYVSIVLRGYAELDQLKLE
jgi:hypothetical protein